jgi:hypothetical protein
VRHLRMVGVCLVAMFAITAIASASASAAQPEYMRCVKAAKVGTKYTGKYTNSLCTLESETKEGKFEVAPFTPPASFSAKGTATTFYYWKPGTPSKIIWKVQCKSDVENATIEEPTTLGGTITLKECSTTNNVTKVKTVACPSSLEIPFFGILRESTVPASPGFGVTYLYQTPAFSCGGATFEVTTGFPFSTGVIGSTYKGVWAVNTKTGEQKQEGWLEEGEPDHFAPTEVEVTQGASSEALRFGLATSEPLVAKGVVIK